MLEYLIGGVVGGVVGWMAKARSCGTTPQNGGAANPTGGAGNLTLDQCGTAIQTFLGNLDPASKTLMQNAIATSNSAQLEQFASIVQGTNPQLATCIRNLKKA